MTKIRNRGKESNDDKCFAAKWLPVFTKALDDMSYLLSHGYTKNASILLVGNRYKLNSRQRNALLRMACSKQEKKARAASECAYLELEDERLEIDGFNLLILLESAMSGAYVFKGRDSLYRDISGVHGSYKRVIKTESAILLIGDILQSLKPKSIKWYLDQPVSNSGRLKTRLMEISRNQGYNWEVELVFDPDKVLAVSEHVVISSDGWILDQSKRWFNLGAYILEGEMENINAIVA